MARIRVYELARLLGKPSKEVLQALKDLGIEVKTHMSTIDEETAEQVMDLLEERPKKEREKRVEEEQAEKPEKAEGGEPEKPAEEKRVRKVAIEPPIFLDKFAEALGVAQGGLKAKIEEIFGMEISENEPLSVEIAQRVASEYKVELAIPELEKRERSKNLVPRPPVVTVMGHVDHGKTTLLDTIRKTNVAAREAGQITQHIGAYQVEIDGKKITFIDTPGHEAFTTLRARGAQVTDIVILVVAADDGVMPQTIEALNHARAANVPIIVAVNKIDKPNADPTKVRRQLSELGLVPEEWGGDTIFVDISALRGDGVKELLEMVLLVAEVNELKADPTVPARGVVIESRLDKGKGPVATVIVQEGTLKRGDPFIAGITYGRVRAMFDDKGRQVKEAPPSTPVEVLGFSELPQAGDVLTVVSNEVEAREIAEKRKEELEEKRRTRRTSSLEEILKKIQEGEQKQLNVVLKADTQGSVEAIRKALQKIKVKDLSVRILHAGVGAISESDVMLAEASNAVVLGFNVRPDSKAKALAEREKVEVRTYRVIYQLLEDVESMLKGMLEPVKVEKVIGTAEVKATFKISGVGIVAGCYVREGIVRRNAKVRVVRDGTIIHEGEIASLRRFKEDVTEVREGYECGIKIRDYNDVKVGDVLEVFVIEEKPPV